MKLKRKIQRMGGSIVVTIPNTIRLVKKLNTGDNVTWIMNDNDIKVQFETFGEDDD